MSVIDGQVESSDIDLKFIQIDIGNKINWSEKQINIFCNTKTYRSKNINCKRIGIKRSCYFFAGWMPILSQYST